MASSDVFKDLHANEIVIANNTSDVNVSNLIVKNVGSGDAVMKFSNSASNVLMGIDNSGSGDPFVIRHTGTGLAEQNNISLTTGGVAVGGAVVTGAGLAVVSTNTCFMPPRMTSAQMEAIATLSGGMVYNITSGAMYINTSKGAWHALDTVKY